MTRIRQDGGQTLSGDEHVTAPAWQKAWHGVGDRAPTTVAPVLVGLIALLALAARIGAGPLTYEDAYITFRFARNIVHGQGFVYNPGDHVLGTTTPLFTLLLALLAWLTREPYPWIALIVAAIADGVTTIVLAALAYRAGAGRTGAVCISALFAVAAPSIQYAQSGLETSLFSCLLILCCWWYVNQRDILWGVAGGLAVLTRPEAVLLLLILGVDAACRQVAMPLAHPGGRYRRILPWKAIAAVAVVDVPWAVWATWYFGQPISQSVIAKSGAVYHLTPVSNVAGVLRFLGGLPFGGLWPTMGLLVMVQAIGLSWIAFGSTIPRLRTAILFVVLLYLAYMVVGLRHVMLFDWYPAAATPVLCLFIVTAAAALLAPLGQPGRAFSLMLLSGVLVAMQLNALSLGRLPGLTFWSIKAPLPRRETTYQDICRHLAPAVQPGTVIAAPEVGTIGFYCPGVILDTIGLVTHGVGAYYPVPASQLVVNNAIPSNLIADLRPDYVISYEVYVRLTLLRDPRFLSSYHEVYRLYNPNFGDFLVFERAVPGLDMPVPVTRLACRSPGDGSRSEAAPAPAHQPAVDVATAPDYHPPYPANSSERSG